MRSNSLFIFILSFWFIIVAAHSSAAQLADDQVRISEIRVEGNICWIIGTPKRTKIAKDCPAHSRILV